MKRRFLAILIGYVMAISTGWAQDLWPSVTKEMKPWTRWWWLGSAVDKPNLSREIKMLDEAGFGGVEVTPIYGAKGYENRYIPFLSETWMDMLAFTVDQAEAHSMGVDINLGTGWPFGGPQVEEEHAATKLFLDEIELKKGQSISFPLGVSDSKQSYSKLQALRAYGAHGQQFNLDDQISKNVDSWTAPEDVRVIALFSGRTRQRVKRAAPGGEGFTLDHLGKESVQRYFHYFQKAFQGKDLQIRAFFNDSYEVYGANWTDSFLEEFEKRKGYKLQSYLLDFAGKGDDKEREKRIKSDYREVVNDVLRDNFLIPFTSFSNQYTALSKNQAHGSPGNLIDLYASTDIAECETFGSSFFAIPDLRRDSTDVRNVDPDPMMFKFASSATHTSGKRYTSSETFTWLTEHFKTSLAQTKPEVEQLFLAGVNHVFYHGTTYSPEDVPYPGWLFYASVNFTTNNSFWPHLSALNSYITRVQSILQTTKADHELLVYWPIYDVWHDTKAPFKTLSVHHVDQWLHPTEFYKQSMYLQRLGYGFDFVTDAILARATVKDNRVITADKANPYKVIYIPEATYFSEKTLENLLTLARNGATVIFEKLPKDVGGLVDLEARRQRLKELLDTLHFKDDEVNQYTKYGQGKVYLTDDVYSALETEYIYAERLVRTGLKFSRRVVDKGAYYYLVNHTDKMIDQYVHLNYSGKTYTLLDPQTGEACKLPTMNGAVRVQIPSGYAWIVYVSDTDKVDRLYRYVDQLQEENVFLHPWKVSFISGGAVLPQTRALQHLSYWTDWGDEVANKFAGTAAYETSFTIDKKSDKSYQLQLGSVGESARVFINGKDAGIVWAHPFTVEVGALLQNGDNKVRIEVANLMANRMRDLDRRNVPWRNYHEINFVNIDYKNFDASQWELINSGLKGPVKLFSY